MIDKLKIPIDKFFYEKINDLGLLFYLIIAIFFALLFIIILNSDNAIYIYSPFVIFLSVTIVFIQMNYNIYETKKKKEDELNLRTMEILERKYLNVNLFTKEEFSYLNTLVDGDFSVNKMVIYEETFPLKLREKILKQYNLLEYLCSLVQEKLISKEMFSLLMDKEISFWSINLQLLTIIGGLKPNFFIEYLLTNNMIDRKYLNSLEL